MTTLLLLDRVVSLPQPTLLLPAAAVFWIGRFLFLAE
jgi:hypothetical protein